MTQRAIDHTIGYDVGVGYKQSLFIIVYMRGIHFVLAICLLFTLTTALEQSANETPMVEFVKGLLGAVGEKGDIQKLMSCIKESEAIFNKIKEALDHIHTVKREEVAVGLKQLIEAMTDLMSMLKACLEGFDTLKRLITEMGKADIDRLTRKVLSAPGTYFHLSMDGLEAFADKKYAAAGKAVGTMLKLLFLSRMVQEESPMVEFVKGLLGAVGEKGDIQKLMSCIKESEAIFNKIKEALDHIHTVKREEVAIGLKQLIEAMTDLMSMLKACLEGFDTLKRLITEMGKADIDRLTRKVLSAPGTYFHLSMDGLEAFADKKYAAAGKAVGTMLKLLFLSRTETSPMTSFVAGLAQGVNEKGDVNKLQSCIKENDPMFEQLRIALDGIKDMQRETVAKGAKLLLQLSGELLGQLKPCLEGFDTLKRLANEISKADIDRVVKKILSGGGSYFHLALNGLEGLLNKDYAAAGEAVGTILRLLLLSRSRFEQLRETLQGAAARFLHLS